MKHQNQDRTTGKREGMKRQRTEKLRPMGAWEGSLRDDLRELREKQLTPAQRKWLRTAESALRHSVGPGLASRMRQVTALVHNTQRIRDLRGVLAACGLVCDGQRLHLADDAREVAFVQAGVAAARAKGVEYQHRKYLRGDDLTARNDARRAIEEVRASLMHDVESNPGPGPTPEERGPGFASRCVLAVTKAASIELPPDIANHIHRACVRSEDYVFALKSARALDIEAIGRVCDNVTCTNFSEAWRMFYVRDWTARRVDDWQRSWRMQSVEKNPGPQGVSGNLLSKACVAGAVLICAWLAFAPMILPCSYSTWQFESGIREHLAYLEYAARKIDSLYLKTHVANAFFRSNMRDYDRPAQRQCAMDDVLDIYKIARTEAEWYLETRGVATTDAERMNADAVRAIIEACLLISGVESNPGPCVRCGDADHSGPCDAVICSKCGRVGHSKEECRAAPAKNVCYYCHQPGHYANRCRARELHQEDRAARRDDDRGRDDGTDAMAADVHAIREDARRKRVKPTAGERDKARAARAACEAEGTSTATRSSAYAPKERSECSGADIMPPAPKPPSAWQQNVVQAPDGRDVIIEPPRPIDAIDIFPAVAAPSAQVITMSYASLKSQTENFGFDEEGSIDKDRIPPVLRTWMETGVMHARARPIDPFHFSHSERFGMALASKGVLVFSGLLSARVAGVTSSYALSAALGFGLSFVSTLAREATAGPKFGPATWTATIANPGIAREIASAASAAVVRVTSAFAKSATKGYAAVPRHEEEYALASRPAMVIATAGVALWWALKKMRKLKKVSLLLRWERFRTSVGMRVDRPPERDYRPWFAAHYETGDPSRLSMWLKFNGYAHRYVSTPVPHEVNESDVRHAQHHQQSVRYQPDWHVQELETVHYQSHRDSPIMNTLVRLSERLGPQLFDYRRAAGNYTGVRFEPQLVIEQSMRLANSDQSSNVPQDSTVDAARGNIYTIARAMNNSSSAAWRTGFGRPSDQKPGGCSASLQVSTLLRSVQGLQETYEW